MTYYLSPVPRLNATNSDNNPMRGIASASSQHPQIGPGAYKLPSNSEQLDGNGVDSRPKGVGWVDDQRSVDTAVQSEQGDKMTTFYREPTPPPAKGHDDYHVAPDALQTNYPQSAEKFYDYSYDRVAPPAPIPEATIFGLRKRKFRMILAAIVLVAMIVIGVGVGVGVSNNRASADATQPSSTTEPTSTATATATLTVSSQPEPTLLSCPAANGTRYLVTQASKTFLRICGVDYIGGDGAVDLGVVITSSMQDCINSCAGYPNCTGCSWGVIAGDVGSDHRCWLKTDLKQPTVVRSGWDFAILQ